MKLKKSKILKFLLSIQSIIYINLFIKFSKILNKDIKVVFFYFPVKSYQDNILELIDEIKREKNIKVILGYNFGSAKEVKDYDKAFFLNLGYLKYIKKVDIFLSSYVVYEFPESLNKIYINHDIYDTPMVDVEKEKGLINTLNKCDYIFLSSDIAVSALQKKIDEYTLSKAFKKKPQLINTGYLKLDHVYKKLKNDNSVEDSVLLAPTLSSMLTNYNLDEFLDPLINELLKNTSFKIIYRPHPVDKTNSVKNCNINNIYEKYKNNKNFTLDINSSYLDSYKKSKILITDFSGTAYTYSFSQNKPVIFFSYNENEIIKKELSKLNYFIDRKKIGYIVNNFTVLNQKLKKIQKNNILFGKKIDKLKKIRIKNFGNSLKVTKKTIESML